MDRSPTTAQHRPTTCSLRPTLSASCSQPRRTTSRGNQLDMAAPATHRSDQWQPCVANYHTYDVTAPPTRSLYRISRKATSGNIYKGTTSRPPSELFSDKQAHQSVSLRRTSARTISCRWGSWLSSWRKWNQTQSAWWGGDGVTQISSTSTRQKIVLLRAYWLRCSNMEPTRSF